MSGISIEKALELAIEQHQAGHFQRAQELYVNILQQDPGNVDAIHLLGVLALQGKNPQAAIELISRAVGARSDSPVFHYNLANAYSQLPDLAKAAESYRAATCLNPDYAEAWHNLSNVLVELRRYPEAIDAATEAFELADDPAPALNTIGNAHRGLGNLPEAIKAFEEAIAESPEFAEGLNNLGMCHAQQGEFAKATDYYQRAIKAAPTFADAYNNLGVTYLRQANQEKAAETLQMALKLRPDFVEALNNLGVALRDSGRPAEAIGCYEKVLTLAPDSPEVYNNLATAYKDTGRIAEALKSAKRAIELRPDFAEAYFNLSTIEYSQNQIDESIEAGREAVRLAPENPNAHASLGYKLIERGDVTEGIECVRHALALADDPSIYSNALLALNYVEDYSAEQVVDAHKEWGRIESARFGHEHRSFTNRRESDRKLRIGYISPDFRRHSVMTFAEPFLSNHDHDQFEITCYSNVMLPDDKTMMTRVYADRWRDIIGMRGDELVQQILDDEIDILVELAGHTAGNALTAIADKAAPIQVSGIGYPCTTGLPSIDYRISDSYCDPLETSDALNTEKMLRIEPSFWCYRAPDIAPEVAPLPADKQGYITFATVNNFAKVTPEVQDLWAQIIAAVPGSKFILQTMGTGSAIARDRIIERFARHGVDEGRLDLRGHTPMDVFMNLFSEVDIVLDPFPFNGGTTTCHNLWMGAPTIALRGQMHAGRMGMSILNTIGLGELVGATKDDYKRIAVELAGEIDRLRSLRLGMRQRMQNSPLCDESGYTRKLEEAYRRIWRDWCAAHP